MLVGAAQANREDLEQDLSLTRFWHGQVDVLERPRAGETDRRRGGGAQVAESTPGLTTSTSFSIVSRS
jgi:hypothetical protein